MRRIVKNDKKESVANHARTTKNTAMTKTNDDKKAVANHARTTKNTAMTKTNDDKKAVANHARTTKNTAMTKTNDKKESVANHARTTKNTAMIKTNDDKKAVVNHARTTKNTAMTKTNDEKKAVVNHARTTKNTAMTKTNDIKDYYDAIDAQLHLLRTFHDLATVLYRCVKHETSEEKREQILKATDEYENSGQTIADMEKCMIKMKEIVGNYETYSSDDSIDEIDSNDEDENKPLIELKAVYERFKEKMIKTNSAQMFLQHERIMDEWDQCDKDEAAINEFIKKWKDALGEE